MTTIKNCDRVYKLTKYPKLFNGYHWGYFNPSDNPEIGPKIIQARDKFIEYNNIVKQYSIGKVCALIDEAQKHCFNKHYNVDHPEMYQSRDGSIIIIFSNYRGIPPAWLKAEIYPPLYSSDCITFICKFKNVAEIDALRKEAKAIRLKALEKDQYVFNANVDD